MALVNNPLFARYFARFGGRNEERGNRELRQEMLAGLSGRVLEVGPGNGLNFPHYPSSVQEVVAVGARAVPAQPRGRGGRGGSGPDPGR